MSEMYPENISHGELADWVQLGSLEREPSLRDPQSLYEEANRAYSAALDRGDPRAIEESEQRLAAIVEAHPELREQ